MKSLLMLFAALSATALTAANPAEPLLEKRLTDGFVPQAYRFNRVCQVFDDKVVIQYGAGSLAATRSFPVTLRGDLQALVKEAAQGKVVTKPAPTDGPITEWAVYQSASSGGRTRLVLRARGSEIVDNQSVASLTLVNFINQLCDDSQRFSDSGSDSVTP